MMCAPRRGCGASVPPLLECDDVMDAIGRVLLRSHPSEMAIRALLSVFPGFLPRPGACRTPPRCLLSIQDKRDQPSGKQSGWEAAASTSAQGKLSPM
ncbi:hypothetical protein NDU88_001212 [Pleurodeles waltl]|uniref:Uncharacterized protein n=1 Tax=Pleurodeles waltl TaxID=8319 RepID=A0AAV7RA63_PLEWA|nr:hypothetical protein NDU88_001212 [Pleurodeles waltl]